ncbi:hypothetical protein OG594_46940 [Streptomyces sp. NBC_01214]|uniref:hypothetical protein n=1 Tax=Streptomyces sp. NBC_01214 TaxID=2903777 RepID=UPI00225A88F1|nr:hypothetical protein [Streptomyces sp. NBC_01214]MCX4808994.1 hypothetical protein [Streptomyces sp. NBC_01214]
MSEIPEEAQAAALRAVVEAATARDEAQDVVAERVADLQQVCVAAAATGASRTRIRTLAGVSSKTFYEWLNAAGLDVRPQQSRR